MVIIWLMWSDMMWPKVITLSGANSIKNFTSSYKTNDRIQPISDLPIPCWCNSEIIPNGRSDNDCRIRRQLPDDGARPFVIDVSVCEGCNLVGGLHQISRSKTNNWKQKIKIEILMILSRYVLTIKYLLSNLQQYLFLRINLESIPLKMRRFLLPSLSDSSIGSMPGSNNKSAFAKNAVNKYYNFLHISFS